MELSTTAAARRRRRRITKIHQALVAFDGSGNGR